MVNTKSDGHASATGGTRRWRTVGMALALAMAAAGTMASTAAAQPIRVSGTVQSTGGAPLRGVIVRALGTDSVVTTNDVGRYQITAPAAGNLSFTYIGHRPVQEAIAGRTTIDVRMERIAVLDQVVVTAYSQEQQRGEITGAVATVNLDAADRQTTASVLQRLDATVSGVTVDASGSPGSRSTVRIRGISSFQNNDPLYIIDGTPVQDSYINFLNTNDIASIQVLKDASAASIYGSRASNGVVIIETTKRGQGAPRANLRVRTGVASPVRGYDDFLIQNSLDYYDVVLAAYRNAGYAEADIPTNIYGSTTNPTVPAYIFPNNCNPNPCQNVDLATYSYPNTLIMPGSQGTNWWDAVFSPAFVGDYNLDVSGGTALNTYFASFNWFDQEGTAAFNRFNRGSIRVNTGFTRSRLQFGENIALSAERSVGGVGDDSFGEGGFLGKNILSQPVVPIYDVAGNFASGKATTLGNNDNPLKIATARKDNVFRTNRVFGNVFGQFNVSSPLTLRTQFGFNLGANTGQGFNPITPENAEPNFTNSIFESNNRFTEWTWTNTARYGWTSGTTHNLSLLAGQEATRFDSRFIQGTLSGLISEDVDARYIQDALGIASSKNVTSSGAQSSLLSFFGKADYTLLERYTATVTVRRDGSSRFAETNRWGTFPAFGLGWRVSQEPFFRDNRWFTDVGLRVGYGITGNQNIPSGRITSQFGGDRGDTYYAIGGGNTITGGFRETRLGNSDLRWEENKSVNVGADVSFLNGFVDLVLDVYQRNTDNLLFDPPVPGTSGVASAPIVNVGEMRNRGFEVSLSHRAASWSVTLNGSHYNNKIIRIDGVQDFFYGPIATRYGNQVINKVDNPIGSFYGYKTAGYFQSQAEIDALNAAARAVPGASATTVFQDGAQPGRIRFVDTDGDGRVTLSDRTIIGSPHPSFSTGLDFEWRRGSFDLASTVFGTFGNEIFDAQKEFYIFRNFSTNVRSDRLANSWTEENRNAKYPRLDQNDTYSYALSDFYVEDGSYVRLRNVQVGYTLPSSLARFVSSARVYIQGENLFTITGYDGLDPSLPAANVSGAAGDIRDQYRGVDRGTYPSNRTVSIGINTSF